MKPSKQAKPAKQVKQANYIEHMKKIDFSIKSLATKNLTDLKSGCIVVGVFEKMTLSHAAQALDHQGGISAALASGDISGKPGSTLLLRNVNGVAAERVLLVGLGKIEKEDKEEQTISEKNFLAALNAINQAFSKLGTKDAAIALPMDAIKERDVHWAVHQCVLTAHENAYRSDMLKSKKDPAPDGVNKITVALDLSSSSSTVSIDAADSFISTDIKAKDSALKQTLAQSLAIAQGMHLTKDLGNLPGNICTPSHLAQVAQKLAQDYDLEIEVLDRKQMEALKMNCLLSVTNGSQEAPKFIILKHMGGKAKDAPVVLVGKGITFDSGGISLKPGAAMDEMKYDMCGAASVLGTLHAVAAMKLKLNVIGVIASCENMPSGTATKPGDIVTSMAGLTVEILNTDAEGRLILCDALTYVERLKPAAVIDIATLTGACIVALGHHNSGLFTRHDAAHDQLASELLEAGKASSDTAWRMPIEEAYQEQLKSNFADIANIGTPGGASVTAACFLEYFTKKYTWAHLDIAGTAWKSGAKKGATGRPVPLLTTFLIQRAGKS